MTHTKTAPDASWESSVVTRFTDILHQSTLDHCRNWPEDDGELNVAEGVRQTFRLAATGFAQLLESNPDYPELIKGQTLNRQVQLPSADAVYHYARLHGRNRYRLSGNRGSAHIFQISTWNGSCCDLKDYRLVAKQDSLDDDHLAAGKAIDIVISREKPDGGEAWLELPEGPCELWVRQYYNDWDTEEAALLTIEALDRSYPPPVVTKAEVEERLRMAGDWLVTHTAYLRRSVQLHLDADPSQIPLLSIPEAFQDNVYLCGHYRCQHDEAVVIEVTPPDCYYWGFQLANVQWEAMDYHMRQTSLNRHQAAIDADGVLRIVISHRDPGVTNWFDTSGRMLGLLSGRYFKSKSAPVPKVTNMPFAELGQFLPPATVRVTPDQRQTMIRDRLHSAYRRLCGDV